MGPLSQNRSEVFMAVVAHNSFTTSNKSVSQILAVMQCLPKRPTNGPLLDSLWLDITLLMTFIGPHKLPTILAMCEVNGQESDQEKHFSRRARFQMYVPISLSAQEVARSCRSAFH